MKTFLAAMQDGTANLSEPNFYLWFKTWPHLLDPADRPCGCPQPKYSSRMLTIRHLWEAHVLGGKPVERWDVERLYRWMESAEPSRAPRPRPNNVACV